MTFISDWYDYEQTWFNNKYFLTKFLGVGGFGAVFEADETVADRFTQKVAIKIVLLKVDNIDEQIAEFQKSVNLKHPSLIDYKTCEDGKIYKKEDEKIKQENPDYGTPALGLVMELAECSLYDYLVRNN